MAQTATPFLIPFGDFGMVAHPNRWRAQAGELVLAENHVLENDLLQKDPSSTHYYMDAGISAGGPGGDRPAEWFSFNATWGGTPGASYFFSVWVEGWVTTAPVKVAFLSQVAAGATVVRPIQAAVAAGRLVAVTFSREAGTGALSTLTDTQGNIYTLVTGTQLGGGSIHLEIWLALITKPLTTSDTLTFTFTTTGNDVNALVYAYTGTNLSMTPFATMSYVNGYSDNPPTRPHKYPALGITVCAAQNTGGAVVITTAAPWVPLDYVNTANHTTYQLYQSYLSNGALVGQIEWNCLQVPSGTPNAKATITKGSRLITFAPQETQIGDPRPGDQITIDGETQTLDYSDNAPPQFKFLTIDPWEHTATAVTYSYRVGPRLITAATTEDGFVVDVENPMDGARGRHGELDQGDRLLYPVAGVTCRAVRFVVGGKEVATQPRKLFLFTGVLPVKVLKGIPGDSGFVPLTTPPADWATTVDPNKQPINGIVHQDALLGFGNLNDPHRVYFSQTQDHTVFTGSDAFQLKISSNIGQRLYGCAQYQGVLFFWKYPNGIFYLDDTGFDRLTQWGYRVRSEALGCAPSPHAVLSIDDDVIFCDAAGHFHLLSAVNTLGGTADSDLTRMLGLQRWTQQTVDLATLDQLVSVYDPYTKTAWFGLRSQDAAAQGRADNDLIIRFDFARAREQGGRIRVTTSRTWLPNSLCLKRQNYTGRACVLIGEIADSWMIEPDEYGRRTDFDWIAYQAVVRGIPTTATLPEHDCDETNQRLRHLRKSFRTLEVVAQETATLPQTLFVDLYVDTQFRQTVSFRLNGSRRMMDTLSVGEGYTLTATCRTDGSVAADAPLIGLIVYFEPTGTDMSRRS